MSQTRQRKGPAGHRFLVTVLNIVLAVLVYWLLGFIIDDISSQPAPTFEKVQKGFQNQALVKERETLSTQITKHTQSIAALQKQQEILQTSINGYKDTMNQLLDLQKASLQKGAEFTSESQQNLANATKLYLDNQQQFQNLNQSIANANVQSQALVQKQEAIDTELTKQGKEAYKTYEQLQLKHNLMLASLKLLVLVPLLLIVAYFFRKYRKSIYISMIVSVGIAIFIKIVMVMHEHFPSRFFKYVLILALIYLVARFLINRLKMVAAPQKNWLIKQYREAYQKLQCPMCQYPIQPGALKFTSSQNTKLGKPSDLNYLENIVSYSCPSCGEKLFEKCEVCSHSRYSLLMFCDYCGAEKPIGEESC